MQSIELFHRKEGLKYTTHAALTERNVYLLTDQTHAIKDLAFLQCIMANVHC